MRQMVPEMSGLTLADALARLGGVPAVACLDGGPGGISLLAWGDGWTAGLPAVALADGPERRPPAWGRTWSDLPDVGSLVQIDYEGQTLTLAARGWMRWDATGRCHRAGDPLPADAVPLTTPRLAGGLRPAWDRDRHIAQVATLRDHIAAGDCYQVNLTLPFHGRLAAGGDVGVFLALRQHSPAPFAGFFRRPGLPSVISHSPECFLAWQGRRVLSAPIKGTRRNVGDPAVRDALLDSAKDRAELAMIVDLVRNDLGRVAIPGTVRVPDPVRLMDLPYVHHLVAEVVASARRGTTVEALLAAAFPAGSITGAPKRMAMELIRRLESGPRGAYCGAFGWISDHGGELAVAIRTLTVDGDRVTLHAGSGITADSDGAAEWDEVRAKASAMATALGGTI